MRRVGKTTNCKLFPKAIYFDCELPSVRRQLENPEFFLSQFTSDQIVVLDEIHRIFDPSEVLKIASDHFPHIKVVATGSSTLHAKKKFKDSLTGRKNTCWIQPLGLQELKESSFNNLSKRLLYGGLPPAFLSEELDDNFYNEWLDSFWAQDIQELFAIDKKPSFLKLAELILRQSGELFVANSFTAACEVSRQTVQNYLNILETTLFVHIVRPFPTNRDNDIISATKVYGFDTGFVSWARSWSSLRPEDFGILLEHLILEEIKSIARPVQHFYWRDKQKNEIDFIVKKPRGDVVHTIECKSKATSFSTKALGIFREMNPTGKNFVVAADIINNYKHQMNGFEIEFVNPWNFKETIENFL